MFNGPLSGTNQVSRYQKGKTNLDFTEVRDGEWQWRQLGHMQICTLLQTNNHASTPPLSFLQARCPSCRPTNSVKALKAKCEIIWSNQVTQNIYTSLFVKFYICHSWSFAPSTKEFICSEETAKKAKLLCHNYRCGSCYKACVLEFNGPFNTDCIMPLG